MGMSSKRLKSPATKSIMEADLQAHSRRQSTQEEVTRNTGKGSQVWLPANPDSFVAVTAAIRHACLGSLCFAQNATEVIDHCSI